MGVDAIVKNSVEPKALVGIDETVEPGCEKVERRGSGNDLPVAKKTQLQR